MKYYFLLTRMVRIKKTDNKKCWQDVEKLEPSYTACGNVRVQRFQKTVWQFLKWLNIEWHIIQQFQSQVFPQKK